jgi:TPR repeat protein
LTKLFLKRILPVGVFLFFLLTEVSFGSSSCDPRLLSRAHNGDVNAQSYVAHHYTSGEKGEQDYHKAKYWYQKVASHKTADAKIKGHANLLLGLMYNSGKGGKKNYQQAMKCFRTAAEQGYYDAHISIGNMYAQGLGVKQDYNKALFWWKLAAEKGHPKAPTLVHLMQKEIRNARTSG